MESIIKKSNGLILLGGGGHCSSCIDVIESESKYEIVGIVESHLKGINYILGYPIIGFDDDIPSIAKSIPFGLVSVGQIKSAVIRKKLFNILKSNFFMLPTVISPRSYCSPHSKIGEGTIVMHQALINAGAVIGENCIINSQALIEHGVLIENHCHISTGARVNGDVQVGEGSFIGSGAILREGVRIGRGAIIGAGSIVLSDVAPGAILKDSCV